MESKIKYVSYPHLKKKSNGIKDFEEWEKEQKKIYNVSQELLREKIIDLSSELKIPLSETETKNMLMEVINYSGIPILSYVESSKNLKDRILLYLGAGSDIEHASLFMANINLLVDNYSKEHIKMFLDYFKQSGYNIEEEISKDISKLTIKLNENSKKIILIKEDINNYNSIYDIINNIGYKHISFLINKKTSRQEASLPFLNNLEKNGLFLQSDWNVYENLPGFNEKWYGILSAYRLQEGGECELYPAKLFQKI